jgi:cytochrome b561
MTDTYDSRTIVLHWATAVLVLGLWALGQCIDLFPQDAPRIAARSVHITLGLALALLLAARLAWRVRAGVKLGAASTGIVGRLAVGGHHLLYVLLCAVVLMGMACVWIRGDTLFNLFTVPAFDPGNKALRHDAVELHGLLANTLLGVAALHAAAAIWHHRVLKDGVLRRMWPALQVGSKRPPA